MGVPVWSVGQVLAAADVNSWFVPIAASKPADTSRASNIVLAADPDLTVTVAASATYDVEFALSYTGPASGQFFKWDFLVPSGTFTYGSIFPAATGTVVTRGSSTNGSPPGTAYTDNATFYWVMIRGTLVVGVTPGTFALEWCQNTTNVTAVTVKAQSHMTLHRIA